MHSKHNILPCYTITIYLFISFFTRAMHIIARSLLRHRVCPSVCPSVTSSIVSKPILTFFDHMPVPSLELFDPSVDTQFQVESLQLRR